MTYYLFGGVKLHFILASTFYFLVVFALQFGAAKIAMRLFRSAKAWLKYCAAGLAVLATSVIVSMYLASGFDNTMPIMVNSAEQN